MLADLVDCQSSPEQLHGLGYRWSLMSAFGVSGHRAKRGTKRIGSE